MANNIKNAINTWNSSNPTWNLEKDFAVLGKSSLLAWRKIYLSYDNATGWKIKALNIFQRAWRTLTGLNADTHLKTVHTQLSKEKDLPLELNNRINALFQKHCGKKIATPAAPITPPAPAPVPAAAIAVTSVTPLALSGGIYDKIFYKHNPSKDSGTAGWDKYCEGQTPDEKRLMETLLNCCAYPTLAIANDKYLQNCPLKIKKLPGVSPTIINAYCESIKSSPDEIRFGDLIEFCLKQGWMTR